MIGRIVKSVLLIAIIAVAALYLPLDFLRAPVERALERDLGRKVEVGEVHLDLFGAPGFTLDDVVIHEDPRAGIEPFAYVPSLDARLRWLSLLQRHLEFSYLNLREARYQAPTLNLVKTAEGPWNFQFLLDSASRGQTRVPAIRMRAGRVNFKFGDVKSIFYFNQADLNVDPANHGFVELRFEGAPSQTDRSAQDFGRFFINGTWDPARTPRLDMNVDLERSSLAEVSRLFDPQGFGLHGTVALQAHLSGAPNGMEVNGLLQVDDVHRWDLVPKGGGWKLPFKGSLDLHGEKLDLASEPGAPVVLAVRGWDFLSKTRWEADADLNQVPLADLAEVARHLGAAVSDQLTAEGGVSGSVSYNQDGFSGQVELKDASLALPDAQPLRAKSAAVEIHDGIVRLKPSTIEIGARESAELEASYNFVPPQPNEHDQPRQIDLRISTKGMSVGDMRSFGVAAIPVLDQTKQGTWRGWARYHGGEWTGEYDLVNARIAVEGLADPVAIRSASVKLNGARVAVTKLRAKVGDVAFTGEYRWEPNAARPHKFSIAIAEADAAELARLLSPTLDRERGFLARTLRLAAAPLPEWLKGRRADGTVSIGSLTAGESSLSLNQARLLWDGGILRLTGIDAAWLSSNLSSSNLDGASLAGDLEADLSGTSPRYHFDGTLNGAPYKGGRLDFDGSLDAAGDGLALLDSLHAEGHIRGRSISFPDADFATASACFELQSTHWKFGSIEVTQNGETYYGSGAIQADGKLALDLAKGSRQVHVSGPALASAP